MPLTYPCLINEWCSNAYVALRWIAASNLKIRPSSFFQCNADADSTPLMHTESMNIVPLLLVQSFSKALLEQVERQLDVVRQTTQLSR